MGRVLKKCYSTILGGNSNLSIDLLNTESIMYNIYTEIQRVKKVETFNLKSATDDASLMSRGRLFHSPTILLI